MKLRVAALAAALAGLAVLGACDAGTGPGRRRASSVRASYGRSTPPPVRSVEPDGGARLPGIAHLELPPEGIAVQEGDAVLLLSVHGGVLHRLEGFTLVDSLAGDVIVRGGRGLYAVDAVNGTLERRSSANNVPLAYGARLVQHGDTTALERGGVELSEAASTRVHVSWDRDVVTVSSSADGAGSVAYDLRTGTNREIPEGCHVADRHDQSWYLTCHSVEPEAEPSRIVRVEPGGREVVLARTDGYGWITVMVSPDGGRFAAMPDYDCGGPSVDLGSTSGGGVRSLGAVTGAGEEPNAAILGWTLSGSLLFEAAGSCGPPLQGLGVYAFVGNRARAVYVPREPEADRLAVAMWTLRPGEERYRST